MCRVDHVHLGEVQGPIGGKRSRGSSVQLGQARVVFVSIEPPVLGEGRHEGHCGDRQPLEAFKAGPG